MRRAPHKNKRPRSALPTAEDRSSSARKWLIVFIVVSLLIHALLVVALVFIVRHTPPPPDLAKDEPPPKITLTLQPPPPHRPDFIPTDPQKNAPQAPSPFISDNDNELHSKSQKARAPDVPLPDMSGQKNRPLELHNTPAAPPTKAPVAPPAPPSPPTPPTPPTPAKPEKPTKPTPPQPEQPSQMTPTATPVKTPPQKPVPQDPNGLPVLPPLDAPTLAPAAPPTTQPPIPQRRPGSPPPSFAVRQNDFSGQVGSPGDNSPQAMATDLGRYKAKVYRAVGSRWYAAVDKHFDVLGTQVGTVHVSYTIYADGHLVITLDPDKNRASLEILHDISVQAILDAVPFEPFSEAMKRDVGESFSDDFTFSIYGAGE